MPLSGISGDFYITALDSSSGTSEMLFCVISTGFKIVGHGSRRYKSEDAMKKHCKEIHLLGRPSHWDREESDLGGAGTAVHL